MPVLLDFGALGRDAVEDTVEFGGGDVVVGVWRESEGGFHLEPERGHLGGVFDDEGFVDFEVADVDTGVIGVGAAVVLPDVGGDGDGHVSVEACRGEDDAIAAMVGDCGSEVWVIHAGADDNAGVVEGI